MPKEALTPQALAAQVVARQKFLEEVLSFVTAIVSKRGKVLYHKVHDWHTETKAELKNFAGFSFYTYGSYSMFGGETAKVWYHTGLADTSAEPVLEVEWWDIKQCTVKRFDPSAKWQRAIKAIMKNEDRVAKIVETKRKTAEARQRRIDERDRKLRQAEANILKEAARLGLAR
jgi:hypothetical protein